MRQVVLDTETTGLDPNQGHRIIELGCVEMINRRITRKTFHYYLNPERDVDAGALAVHGITQDFLLDKPVFSDIAHEFLDFIQDAELIIHNAAFDVGFLNHELGLLKSGKKLENVCRVFDTLTFARSKHRGQRNSLDALCKRYEIDNEHRTLHGALLDAEILAEVYLAMTGGQENLLLNTAVDTRQATKTAVVKSSIHDLVVKIQKANTEELLAHEKRLTAMGVENLW